MSGGQYPEWITDDLQELRDCERYHCLPSELDTEDWHVIARHRAIKAAEGQYLRAEADARARRGR